MLSICIIDPLRGTNSVVECDLAKVEVAGSNPVSRFFLQPLTASIFRTLPQIYPIKKNQLIKADSSVCKVSVANFKVTPPLVSDTNRDNAFAIGMSQSLYVPFCYSLLVPALPGPYAFDID